MVQSKAFKGSVSLETFNNRLRLRFRVNGVRFTPYLGLSDTPENWRSAESIAHKIQRDIETDNFDPSLQKYGLGKRKLGVVDPTQQTIANLPELWKQYFDYVSVDASPKTIDGTYNRITSLLSKVKTNGLSDPIKFRMELLQITTQDQARRALMHLSAACKWGMKHKLVGSNPFEGMANDFEKKKSPPPVAFTAEERDRIIDAFKNDNRNGRNYRYYAPFVEFLFLTGCRPSEAVGLRWINVTPDCSRIYFCESIVEVAGKNVHRPTTKTDVKRWFNCTDRLQNLLLSIKPEQFSSETLVFPSPKGSAIGLSNFGQRGWTKILTELGLKVKNGQEITVYNCRDTFITLQGYTGVSSTVIAKWVGNSAQVIEKKYLDKLMLENLKPSEI